MASVEITLRFKEKDREKKNKEAAFTVAWMKFLLNFQAQKTTDQERIIVERFSSSVPSTTTFAPETVHAVISVIHEKVYNIIQIEVSRKKLESSNSVPSKSSKAETQPERKETRYFIDLVAPRQIEWSSRENKHWHWMGKKEEQTCPNEKWKPALCILMALKLKMIICLMINRHYKRRYWYSLYFQPNHTEQSSVELSQFQSAG